MSGLGEVFRFEVEYRLRRLSTWVYAGLLLLVPFLLLHAVNGGAGWMNNPSGVATASFIGGMVGMLVTAALFGDAATRDLQTGMHPLVYSAPIRTGAYLGGRFLGALLVNAVLLIGVPLGQVMAAAMPYMDPQMFGPFRLDAYVQAYLLLLLPNLVLTAAILFTIASLKRQMLPAFLGGIGLFIVYVVAQIVRPSIADPTLRLLSDPFGPLVLGDHTQYWTPVQQNAEAIGFPPTLVLNRLFWLAIAALILLVLFRRFRFAHPAAAVPRRIRRAVRDPQPARTQPAAVPVVPTAFGAGARMHQTLAVVRRSLEDIGSNRAFVILLAGAVALTFLVGWNVGSQPFGTSIWPVTHLVASTVLGTAVAPVIVILIAVFAGELIWKERELRLSAISDAAPVPDWVLMLGRFLALVTMLAALLAVLMLSGMALQALQGWQKFEPGLYIRILFGIRLPDFILIAALAMAVHVIVNQKYIAHLLVVLVYLAATMAPQFGIQHRLLIYGTGPGWMYSDMNGFGPFTAPIAWFRLYWAAWALLLAVIARVFWVRGSDREVRGSLTFARAHLTGPVLRAGGLAALLIVGLGGFANPFISGRYAVREARWRDVPLRVYHHPAHGVNVERMLRSMQASLEYYSREFGPYQFDELRIVEFPLYQDFVRAHPGTIAFSEGGAFLTRVDPDDVDRTFFVVAHETAHQWWGGQVLGASMPGSAFLSETLAMYSAMMVMESALGADQVRSFYDYLKSDYLTNRTVFTNREVPLLEVENQGYLYYLKGAVAMHTLREHIGAEDVNRALRRYLAKFGGGGVPPFPTSLDLYAEFRAVTPDSLHGLLHDLFAEITLWEVKAESAIVEPTADGQFRVTLELTARKLRADSIGNEREVPMDDLVEVGVFPEGDGAPLYLQRHRMAAGRHTITVIVPRRPARAGIDPFGKLIQREAGDNSVEVRPPMAAAR
jgi:hypothetical protein